MNIAITTETQDVQVVQVVESAQVAIEITNVQTITTESGASRVTEEIGTQILSVYV